MVKVLVVANVPENRMDFLSDIEGVEVVFDSDLEKMTGYQDTEVIIGNPPVEKVREMRNLKWIQLDSAGANLYKDIGDIILTNSSGAYGLAISEYVLGSILMVMRKFPQYLSQQKQHLYHNLGMVKTISGSTALIVGLGNLGCNVAERLKALGCKRIIGVRRSIHDKPEYVDELVDYTRIDEVIPEADIITLSLPETVETIGMFDYERLSKARNDSILVNVGRGSAIVTKDLIRLVREGHFLGVCLDVFEKEPLPQESELWDLERVYLTPHVSGKFLGTEITIDNVLQIAHDNLKRYVASEKLNNIVDKTIGY